MQHSVFKTALKSFLMTFFGIIGIGIGIIPMVLIFALLFAGTENELTPRSNFTFQVAANAEGSRKVLSKESPVILKVQVDGLIGTELFNMQTVRGLLIESREKAFKKNRVKALLLQINSPGGTVTDSDGIYRAIKAYKERYKVPVYAYIDGLCASGGMYIACAADKVFASESSLVGSIGVLSSPSFMNFTELLKKIGVESLTISAGKGKDELNPFRPWKPGEGDMMQEIINSYYSQFVDIVTTARPKMTKDKLIKEYGARVFPATQAKEVGLVDEISNSMNEVITLLAKEIGVEDNYYQVIQAEEKNWLNGLFRGEWKFPGTTVRHKLELGPLLSEEFQNKFLYLYNQQ